MRRNDFALREDYWETLEISESDINFLYNYLIERERPTSLNELVRAFIAERIEMMHAILEKRRQGEGKLYIPKGPYQVGETLIFPAFDWKKGEVTGKRPGVNTESSAFQVIDVTFEDGITRSFASELEFHLLNEPLASSTENEIANIEEVISNHGNSLANELDGEISTNPDLICIANKWFPKALLVDVNIGYRNLAEALLDMEGGGPLSTDEILKQIDLPTDVNQELTGFSLNYALHQDDRFDEVGATGEVVWFLKRLEPEWVLHQPIYLQYQPIEYKEEENRPLRDLFSRQIVDELEDHPGNTFQGDELTISLLYPHWRSGVLPLAAEVTHLFPTALESDRVRFTFIDGNSQKRFSGWVVRPLHYIGGLSEWYQDQGVIPGSLIHLSRGVHEGEVIIRVERRRSTRDWMRTVLVGSDGGIVFAMLKQQISTETDERMAIYIPDKALLDALWSTAKHGKYELTRIIVHMMRELIKLNPQGHVHFEELYAAVNLRFRCPPGLILSILMEQPWATHMGNLYFNLNREHLEK